MIKFFLLLLFCRETWFSSQSLRIKSCNVNIHMNANKQYFPKVNLVKLLIILNFNHNDKNKILISRQNGYTKVIYQTFYGLRETH